MKTAKHLSLLGMMVCVGMVIIGTMTSCESSSPKVEGEITFTCNKELLQYFTPQLKYTNAIGQETTYLLSLENMTDSSVWQTTKGKEYKYYSFKIPIRTNFLGFETSAEVNYIYNGNTDFTTSTDKLYYSLYGTINSISKNTGGGIYIHINNDYSIEINYGEENKTIEEQVEEIKKKTDYIQIIVDKDGKVTKNTNKEGTSNTGNSDNNRNKEDKVEGEIRITCNDKLLHYFTPQVKYINELGKDSIIYISMENITDSASWRLPKETGSTDSIDYKYYSYEIPVNTNYLGFETSVEVRYLYNGNKDNLTSVDKLRHGIFGKINRIIYYDENGIPHIHSDNNINIDISSEDKVKKTIEEQIDEILNTEDYVKIKVSEDAEVTIVYTKE